MKINQGENLPFGYSISYLNFNDRLYRCYLFPFNHIIKWLRCLWFFIRDPNLTKAEVRVLKIINEKSILIQAEWETIKEVKERISLLKEINKRIEKIKED